ncbi:MAG: fibronectin/fibrinogen-binding protein [Clostridiales bacterium]|nr:fibronectin/fibrinogen-binding protein [Clostridiales bacterium]
MAFDGLVTRAIIAELNSLLIDTKIDKIFQPTKDEILLNIRGKQENYKLILSANPANARIHLTTKSYENPSKPFNFCMLLRKYLTNSRIKSISQVSNDRIVKLDFEASNELKDKMIYSLIIEIMGKYSNIILINDSNTIVDSIKHIDFEISSVREVMPARPYILPDNQGKENPFNILNNSANYSAKFITTNYLGISTIFANEIEYKKANLIEEINKPITPCVIFENDKIKDFYIYDITHKNYTYKYFGSISEALDFYSERIINEQKITSIKSELLSTINSTLSKLNKKLKITEEKLESVKDADKLQMQGELLSANLYKLKGNASNITVYNYYENKDIEIPLDINLTPSENLNKIFKKYHKQKNTINACTEQKESIMEDLKYYESILYEIESSESVKELAEIKEELIGSNSKNNTKEKLKIQPLKFNVNGFDIYVGKNNIQNDYVTFKIADKGDYWFHVKNYPGSHTVLKLNKKTPTDDILYEAAKLAATHSKLKNSYTVEVDYTQAKNVKKIPGAKPGMVTYTNFKTIVVKQV